MRILNLTSREKKILRRKPIFEFLHSRIFIEKEKTDLRDSVSERLLNRSSQNNKNSRKTFLPHIRESVAPVNQCIVVNVCARTCNRVRMVSMTHITRPSVTRSCTSVFPGIIQGVPLKKYARVYRFAGIVRVYVRSHLKKLYSSNNEKGSATLNKFRNRPYRYLN